MTFYTFSRSVVKFLMKSLYRIEVEGIENIPDEGGVLLCSNHINNWDPPLVGISSPRPVRFMAKEEIFHKKVIGTIIANLGAFPVKRGMSDREALRKGLKILKNGEVLGLFPEGTRSKNGQLKEGLAGAGFFALRSDASVVPCAIIGPYKRFNKVKIIFGSPIDFTELRANKNSAEQATSLIMNEIRHLLEKYKKQ
ncbi:lysophospholipid acyltransferase family protein [Bacillus carboniphilus]|uniref:Lysophospholipid acyltransferase family protein n=1 Tax=Bacillus carboniphilus TaxID=86663 RepID=A0ABY9JWI5_9BACI|nr:lysophospholipid acyltransferase family protein [Bacillus carboniphilus]WLR43752.1 lysophospholipid acyltransferase family protein [Bacillus carboniphilus]